jgi:hypothetical protein
MRARFRSNQRKQKSEGSTRARQKFRSLICFIATSSKE